MPRKNRRLIYSGNGDAYYVSPSAIGASELNVTTPDITINSPRGYREANERRFHNMIVHTENPGTGYAPPLERVYPEFDIIGLSSLAKDALKYSINNSKGIVNTQKILKDKVDEVVDNVSNNLNIKELAKKASNIRKSYEAAKSLGLENDVPIVRDYVKLRDFLKSPAYRKRLSNYYRDKGSTIVTQNHAPDDRIGEQLYNIETAKSSTVDDVIGYDGNSLDAYGAYFPEEHYIQVDVDALKRQTPIHEMIHASRLGKPYLDNTKYIMRPKAIKEIKEGLSEGRFMKNSKTHDNLLKNAMYYSKVVEQEPRVLNTLMDMERKGYDINNLTDEAINEYFDAPIETFGSDTQSLLENYEFEDIPNALRNFKGLLLPLGIGLTGYGLNQKRLGGRIRLFSAYD